jgi:GntR family transcriptional regulator / MocR family aminotransferase
METDMEITPYINRTHHLSLYIQLYQFFRTEIEGGRIPAGYKLPSIRQLSQQLNVSRNTVENSYQQLIAEGYVESKPKSGLVVLPLEELQFERTKNRTVLKNDTNHASPKVIFDFQYGDIDLECFPYKLWRKCMMDAMDEHKQEIFAYGDKKGLQGLREEIADYLYHARGVDCSADQIVLCSGTQSSIMLLCQLLSLNQELVAVEDPGYDGVRTVFENFSSKVVPISLESDGLNLEELANSKAKICYVTPSHQFPLGMILSIQKRLKLLHWANHTGTYIIEDDYDGEFRYQGLPIPSLASLDSFNRVVYLGTFSKAFLPAARISYLVLPDILLQKYNRHFQHYNQAISPIIQEALYLFMKNGHFTRHIRKMRKIYHEKHKTLLSAIEDFFGDQVQVIGQKAGLHILLQFQNINVYQLVEKAEEKGVKIYLTEKFTMNSDGDNWNQPVLLGFGGMNEEKIKNGIQLLSEVWRNLH